VDKEVHRLSKEVGSSEDKIRKLEGQEKEQQQKLEEARLEL
jgi:hypothetical protein